MRRLGIHVGVSQLLVVMLDESGAVVSRESVAIDSTIRYEHLLNAMTIIAGSADNSMALGVSVEGHIAVDHEVSHAGLPCLAGRSLEDDLRFALQRDLYVVDTYGSCFTLAEATLGAGRRFAMVVGLVLGHPPSGGMALDGNVWRGRRHDAGAWRRFFDAPLRELYESGKGKQALFDEALDMVVTILNPDIVVIGGALDGVDWAPGPHRSGAILRPSELGDLAAPIGAAMMGI